MFAKLARHWGLMNAMSQKSGVDLGAEYLDGKLSRSELRNAVARCTECKQVGDCEAFLDQAAGKDVEIPEYCRNRWMISTLKASKS